VRNIRLKIQYDGSRYHGWQRQPNQITIQETIEEAIKKMTGEDVSLMGSGRTDAGVHALCQVANFYTESKIPFEGFEKGLNSLLPNDISILECREALEEFNSLRDSLCKVYGFYLISSRKRLPVWAHRAWVVARPLNVFKMKKAFSCLEGEHDFSAFQASGSSVKTTVRKVIFADMIHFFSDSTYGDHYFFTIAADGFLRYMVRNIVGMLAQIGMGKRESDEMGIVLESKDRTLAGPTAPPQGLYLRKIFYDKDKFARFLENPKGYLKWNLNQVCHKG
jgi:tRNA pseudouridine38-40 synthase